MIFRYTLLLAFLLFHCEILFSQSLLEETQTLIQSGDLSGAETAVNKAIADPELSKISRTYYLAGFVYKDLFLQEQGELKDEYREKALKNISKGKNLDTEGNLKTQFNQLENYLLSSYFNEGVEYFNNGNYAEAIQSFEGFINKSEIKNSEIALDAYYYTGVGYLVAQNENEALRNFKVCEANGYANPLLYNDLATIYINQGQLEKANEAINTGLNIDANNRDLQVTELNILSGLKKYEEASTKISKYLIAYPNDFDALLMAGTIYEKEAEVNPKLSISNFEKARNVYAKAIELNPDDFHANYNYGVTLYNRGVDLITKKDYDVSLRDLKSVLQESTQLFKESMPYLEKSKKSRPDDVALLQALRGIYYNLDEKEKLASINSELKSLGINN